MTTFFMFGKYSPASVKEISAERTAKATALFEKFGGKLQSGYALLGEYDLILIIDFPNKDQALKASVALSQMLGIAFTTAPAVTVEEFDKLMEDL
jgi:uncharacterized protein with GYD domain